MWTVTDAVGNIVVSQWHEATGTVHEEQVCIDEAATWHIHQLFLRGWHLLRLRHGSYTATSGVYTLATGGQFTCPRFLLSFIWGIALAAPIHRMQLRPRSNHG